MKSEQGADFKSEYPAEFVGIRNSKHGRGNVFPAGRASFGNGRRG